MIIYDINKASRNAIVLKATLKFIIVKFNITRQLKIVMFFFLITYFFLLVMR